MTGGTPNLRVLIRKGAGPFLVSFALCFVATAIVVGARATRMKEQTAIQRAMSEKTSTEGEKARPAYGKSLPRFLVRDSAPAPPNLLEFSKQHPLIGRTLDIKFRKYIHQDNMSAIPCIYAYARRSGLAEGTLEGSLRLRVRVKAEEFEVDGLEAMEGNVDQELAECLRLGWRWLRGSAIAPGEPDGILEMQTGFSFHVSANAPAIPFDWNDPRRWGRNDDGTLMVPPGWESRLGRKRRTQPTYKKENISALAPGAEQ
jgi:hypothetical protein